MNELNPVQRTVVVAPMDHLLVLAGAGSGKTRVLVERIAWLVKTQGINPNAILAVTFTNKAAFEMRHRIEQLLSLPIQQMWIGTFHSLAHRLLRKHWQQANLSQTFQVLDNEDQQRLIRRIIKHLNLDEARWPVRQAQWFINSKKEEGIRSNQVQINNDKFIQTYTKIYHIYEQMCDNNGLVDFSELLLRSYELWCKNADLLANYQSRFCYILVDEFQDTNKIQYYWLKILAGQTLKMMMVGDDDQSIYSWRGAETENLKRFIADFPTAQTIRLEQNYRSTANILNAANAVIAYNQNRLGKNLWTQADLGEAILLYGGFNERDEARFIASQIQEWLKQGGKLNEIAILYRSNAQSRVIEEALLQANLSYRIYGGLKFLERAEIKDIVGYLRLINNPADDNAFERIVNMPTRGIGESTLTLVRLFAKTQQLSLWESTQQMIQQRTLPKRALAALENFSGIITRLIQIAISDPLPELIKQVLTISSLLAHYSQDQSEIGAARVENIEEFINMTGLFLANLTETTTPLAEFLAYLALEAGEHQADSQTEGVNLMTLHAVKGLEFPLVFLSGMEEGLFPHSMASQKPAQLEEERRLCYVGMTRAIKKLCLTYAEARYLKGQEIRQRRSRFIQEIPLQFLQEIRSKFSPIRLHTPIATQFHQQTTPAIGFKIGTKVHHATFGEGFVLSQEGNGAHTRVQVKFHQVGVKWLVLSYAGLQKL